MHCDRTFESMDDYVTHLEQNECDDLDFSECVRAYIDGHRQVAAYWDNRDDVRTPEVCALQQREQFADELEGLMDAR